jgi:hypothetical protein
MALQSEPRVHLGLDAKHGQGAIHPFRCTGDSFVRQSERPVDDLVHASKGGPPHFALLVSISASPKK